MEIDNYSVIHTASSGHGFIEYLRRMWISFTNNLANIAFSPLGSFVWARSDSRLKCCSIRFVKLKTYKKDINGQGSDWVSIKVTVS